MGPHYNSLAVQNVEEEQNGKVQNRNEGRREEMKSDRMEERILIWEVAKYRQHINSFVSVILKKMTAFFDGQVQCPFLRYLHLIRRYNFGIR